MTRYEGIKSVPLRDEGLSCSRNCPGLRSIRARREGEGQNENFFTLSRSSSHSIIIHSAIIAHASKLKKWTEAFFNCDCRLTGLVCLSNLNLALLTLLTTLPQQLDNNEHTFYCITSRTRTTDRPFLALRLPMLALIKRKTKTKTRERN